MKAILIQNRDIVITTELSGREAMKQRLENALKLDKGSWFLAPEDGIDWFAIMQKKQILKRSIYRSVKNILENDSEVSGIQELEITFNREAREIMIVFTVTSTYGDVEGEI